MEIISNSYLSPTSLTVLRMAGWQPELLRIRAGHKNIYTTMNTYVHPSDEEITEEFNRTQPNLDLDIYKEGNSKYEKFTEDK